MPFAESIDCDVKPGLLLVPDMLFLEERDVKNNTKSAAMATSDITLRIIGNFFIFNTLLKFQLFNGYKYIVLK